MPHHREDGFHEIRRKQRPTLALKGPKGPDWILTSSDGVRWTVFNCVEVAGKARRVAPELATFRVFESPGAELRRYVLGKNERRDMIPSLIDRQLDRAAPLKRRTPAAPKKEPGWTPLNDGWDTYREHHGWGPPRRPSTRE